MTWLIENWFLFVAAVAVVAVAIFAIYGFCKQPTSKQAATVREWLIYACTEAEAALGSGTGQLKLRYVWDMFITKFPAMTRMVSFELFSMWVDEALGKMRSLLETNEKIKAVVEGESE